MTDDQERQALREAARDGMAEALLAMGVDINNPKAIQEMQKDMHWLRASRESAENMPKYLRRAGIGAGATLIVYACWYWVSTFLTTHFPMGK